jgi:hypothetical protein
MLAMSYEAHYEELADREPGPILWDAGEGVCCAAAQLGACRHSEAYEPTAEELEADRKAWEERLAQDPALAAEVARILAPAPVLDEEPF